MYCGWPRRSPAVGRLRPPAELAQLGDDARAARVAVRPAARRRAGVTASSAIAVLDVAALQRRVTTGGPIRTPKAPGACRCATIGSSQSREVVGGPVEDRALGQVGEVALDRGSWR